VFAFIQFNDIPDYAIIRQEIAENARMLNRNML
jgi:hypothetical protein